MERTKVFVLMAGLTALLVVLGGAIGGESGALVFFVLAGIMNFAMYWWSDKVVLRMYGARIVGPEDAPDLYRMVDRLRQRAGLPMPIVAIAPSEQPNAFATGRNYNNAVVCVTAGILRLVDREELEGVIAHELAHIKHRHMLVGTIAATMAGAIAMIGRIIQWGAIFGMGRDDEDSNPVALLAMAIIAPIAAMIIQFAISRQNEFVADRTGAEICGRPSPSPERSENSRRTPGGSPWASTPRRPSSPSSTRSLGTGGWASCASSARTRAPRSGSPASGSWRLAPSSIASRSEPWPP